MTGELSPHPQRPKGGVGFRVMGRAWGGRHRGITRIQHLHVASLIRKLVEGNPRARGDRWSAATSDRHSEGFGP